MEDEVTLQRLMVRAMVSLGYEVLQAGNGPEALQVWKHCGKKVDWLISDMVMPEGMTGLELAEKLRAASPELQVIIFSGYPSDVTNVGKFAERGITFLQKPVDTDTFAKAVQDLLP